MFKTVHTVFRRLLYGLAITIPFLAIVSFGPIPYCSPVVNTSGLTIMAAQFAYSPTIAGGVNYFTGNGGYTQTTGSSSGTISRYWGGQFWYNLQNTSGIAKAYSIKVFADWNNDGDFNDFMEDNASNSGTVPASSSLGTGLGIYPPLFASGNIRVRLAMCEGTTPPTACGSFTGEVEDYVFTIAGNTAPVLASGSTPFVNNLLESQTNTDGFTIDQFISSTLPNMAMATDANDAGATQAVPRGLAISGATAPNGSWEYKVGNGAWTPIGSLSSSNTLLLLGIGTNPNYKTVSRLRFVPTGAGTATLTFRLWDGTSGTNGGYANVVSTGGSTAFSSGSATASMQVLSSLPAPATVYAATANNLIYQTTMNRATGTFIDTKNFFDTNDDYQSADIALNPAGTKLVWISGAAQDRIASSDGDGNNVETSVIASPNWITGVAASDSKIFWGDWAPGFFSANLDGSNVTALTGGAGQLDPTDIADLGDIEFANNKIYFVYSSIAGDYAYYIMSANTDGTGLTQLYSTTNLIRGLSVGSSNIYWTESTWDAPALYSILKKPLAGGAATTLASTNLTTMADLTADETNNAVYVITNDNSATGASQLSKVSTGGGAMSVVLTFDGMVNAIALGLDGLTLPVSLTRYDARLLSNKTVELSWATSTEKNNSHYVLERSLDAKTFTTLATVQAKNTNASNSYSWIDKTPAQGVNYYRLVQTDADGKAKELGVRAVVLRGDKAVSIYPNPVVGNSFMLNTGSAMNSKLPFRILNAAGQTVLTGMATQQVQTVNAGQLSAGYYVLALGDGQRLSFSKK